MLSNYSSSKFVRGEIEASNRDVLTQISNNFTNVNKLVRDLCATAFFNTDVVKLIDTNFDGSDDSWFEIYTYFNNIDKYLIATNSYIHSITVYNYKTDKYYNNKVEGIEKGDLLLKDLLDHQKIVPLRKPFLRQIHVQGKSEDQLDWVMTYAMFDSYDVTRKPQGALFINVKPEWILSDIEALNRDNAKRSQIYLYNSGMLLSSRDFNDSTNETDLMKAIDGHILPKIKANIDYGFLKEKINKENYYVSYLNIENIGWTLIRVQSYTEVYKSVRAMQTVIIIITLMFIVVSILTSFVAAKRVYRPMQLLMDKIFSRDVTDAWEQKAMDEIGIIENVYKKSVDTINKNEENKLSMHITVKSFYFMKLLYESSSLSKEDIDKSIKEKYLSISSEGKYALCLLRTLYDGNMEEKKQMSFAAANIANELIMKKYVNDYVTLKNGDAVLLVNFQEEDDLLYKNISEGLQLAQGYVLEYYKTSFSAAISPVYYDLINTSENLQLAYKELDYTYILGRDSIIGPHDVEGNQNNTTWKYSFQLEKQLIDEIREGKLEQVQQILKSMLEEFFMLNHNNIQLSVMHLTTTVKNELEDQKEKGLQDKDIEFEQQFRYLLEVKTIQDYSRILLEYIKNNMKEKSIEKANNNKNIIVIDTIKTIIKLKYSDKSLCTAQIAETIRMNTSYMSRIFKESTDQSVSEYINYVRITTAAEVLINKNISIVQAMDLVGIESEAHFYRHFKKIFDLTPREYILKNSILRSE